MVVSVSEHRATGSTIFERADRELNHLVRPILPGPSAHSRRRSAVVDGGPGRGCTPYGCASQITVGRQAFRRLRPLVVAHHRGHAAPRRVVCHLNFHVAGAGGNDSTVVDLIGCSSRRAGRASGSRRLVPNFAVRGRPPSHPASGTRSVNDLRPGQHRRLPHGQAVGHDVDLPSWRIGRGKPGQHPRIRVRRPVGGVAPGTRHLPRRRAPPRPAPGGNSAAAGPGGGHHQVVAAVDGTTPAGSCEPQARGIGRSGAPTPDTGVARPADRRSTGVDA